MAQDSLFQSIITLFNFHKGTGIWYPTVIYGVHIESISASNHGVWGDTNADSVELRIKSNLAQYVNTSEGPKRYIRPKEYASLQPSEEYNDYFTITPECDFFYDGRWDDPVPVDDDEYDDGFYNAMNRENDGVYLISSAAFFRLIPHFEIGGR